MTERSLFHLAVRGIGWQSVSTFVQVFLTLGVSIVLARLLSPEEFGIVAFAMILIGLSEMFSELGIASALVQIREATVGLQRVAFTLSVSIGASIMILIWAAAPLLVSLLGQGVTASLIRLLSLIFFLKAPGIVANALLCRRMQFERIFVADTVSYVLGYALISISLAASGAGSISLVWGMIGQSVLQSVILYIEAPFSMVPLWSRTDAGSLLHFGTGLTLVRFMNYISTNGPYFIIGRSMGNRALGLFQRSFQLAMVPIGKVITMITAVAFPAFSRVQTEKERMGRAYLTAVGATSFLVCPLVAVVASMSWELVAILYGPQWMECAPSLAILSINAYFVALTAVGDAVAKASGLVYMQLRRYMVFASLSIVLAATGSYFSINAVAAGVVTATCAVFVMISHVSLRNVSLSWRAFLKTQVPGIRMGALTYCAAFLAGVLLESLGANGAVQLLAGKLLGVCLFLWSALAFFPTRWFGSELGLVAEHVFGDVLPQPFIRHPLLQYIRRRIT